MKPNILFIMIDSLKASSFNNPEKTSFTPNIDNLIKKGTYFENNFSCADGTLLSWASIFTSLFPFKTGLNSSTELSINPKIENYFQILKKFDYHPYATIPKISWLKGLSSIFQNADLINYYSKLSDGICEKIISKLNSKNMIEPWIYFIDINDLHLPTWPSKSFNDKKFGNSNYEKSISELDHYIGKIVENLDLDSTLLVITSDHGEYIPYVHDNSKTIDFEAGTTQKQLRNFGSKLPQFLRSKLTSAFVTNETKSKKNKIQDYSLNEYQKRSLTFTRKYSGFCLYDELIHVPLLFVGNCIPKGKTISKLSSSMDIFPTILDMLELEYEIKVDGHSLAPLFNDNSIDEYPVYMERDAILKRPGNDVIGIRTSKYKYFRSPKNSSSNVFLFDISKDPLEENNLKNSRPLLVIEMESKLKKIVQGTNMEQRSIKKFVKPSKEVQDELKRLGYD
jgi:arylsulfatase A-like enzyme